MAARWGEYLYRGATILAGLIALLVMANYLPPLTSRLLKSIHA